METSRQRWSVRLAGLAVLFLLVALTVVSTAQAQRSGGGGSAQPYAQLQLPSAAQVAQHQSYVPRPLAAATLTPGQVIANAEALGHAGHVAGVPAAQPASSGMSATTAWIIAAVVAAGALLVGAWALASRRRRRGELAVFCAQHPEDARCAAA